MSSLSSQRHSAKCNELIALFELCHKEHPLLKFMGYCNEENRQVRRCFKEEREINRRLNAEKSKVKHKEVHERLKNSE